MTVQDVLAEPAPLTPAAERIATAVDSLFYNRGIRATGVDTIAEAAGTTKKTIYDRFGSKDALVALYLVRRARRWQAFLESELGRHAPTAARVLSVFDAAQQWRHDTTRGCAFVNAYAEIGGSDHPGIVIIRAEKAWMRARFTELIAEAGVLDAERMGDIVHLLYEGALVASDVGADQHALTKARNAAEEILTGQSPAE